MGISQVTVNFNKENKPTFDELSTSLQNMILSMTSVSSINSLDSRVNTISAQLGANRISITSDLTNVNVPKNGRELAINTTNYIPYTYQNGWVGMGGVYS